MTFEPAHNVVIDAANFLRDNSKKFVPKKLQLVFSFIQKRGGRPIAILAAGTYGAIIKEQSTNGCDDWTDFTEKLDAGQIRVVEGNDDLYMIQHSLELQVPLLSRDRWNKERSEHPEIDWESLSKLQISNYESTENRFFSEQLHEFLRESLLLRFTNIVFNSCSNSGRCDKSVIMEEMGKEFVSRNTNTDALISGWVEELRSILTLFFGPQNKKVSTWISRYLPSQYLEFEGQIIRQRHSQSFED